MMLYFVAVMVAVTFFDGDVCGQVVNLYEFIWQVVYYNFCRIG